MLGRVIARGLGVALAVASVAVACTVMAAQHAPSVVGGASVCLSTCVASAALVVAERSSRRSRRSLEAAVALSRWFLAVQQQLHAVRDCGAGIEAALAELDGRLEAAVRSDRNVGMSPAVDRANDHPLARAAHRRRGRVLDLPLRNEVCVETRSTSVGALS